MSVMFPKMEPLVVPSPICKVPAEIVVPPLCVAAPARTSVPVPI